MEDAEGYLWFCLCQKTGKCRYAVLLLFHLSDLNKCLGLKNSLFCFIYVFNPTCFWLCSKEKGRIMEGGVVMIKTNGGYDSDEYFPMVGVEKRWQSAADKSRNCENSGERNRYWIAGRE